MLILSFESSIDVRFLKNRQITIDRVSLEPMLAPWL